VVGVTTLSVSERVADSVGPIVVKEVRQGLRARVFAIFFGTLLVVSLAMAFIALADAQDRAGTGIGREFFGAYLTALGGICFFVIPFVAFRSMARELEEETWVLLTLTGLGAKSITRGKWTSAMSQALLFASALAPFVLFTYFLNGIDLVQIVAALALSAVWSALLTAIGIAIATQPRSKPGRTLATFSVLIVLGGATAIGVGVAWELARHGHRISSSDGPRNAILGGVLLASLLTWLVLEGAAAGLALSSEAASAGPRLALTVVTLVALGFGFAVFTTSSGKPIDAMMGQLFTAFFLTVVGPFCISEADGWPPRAGASSFYARPGALRSFLLIMGLLILTTLMWGFLQTSSRSVGSMSEKEARALFGALVYPVMYLSLGVLFGRLTPLRRFGEPVATRVGFVLAVVLGVGLSMMAGLLVDGRASSKLMNALNPIVGLVNFIDRSGSDLGSALLLASAVALLAGFLATLTLSARDLERR